MRSIVVLLLSGAIALATGCARSAAAQHPRGTLGEYVRHVYANNPRGAYRLLSQKVREVQSYEAFERAWRKHYQDLRAQATEIEVGIKKRKSYKLTAHMKVGGLREVRFVHDGTGWRIKSGVTTGVEAASPREAVLALVRALEGRNFQAFLKLLTKSRREAFTREITQRLEKLKANLDRAVDLSGNRARFQYDPRFWIQLVKENGSWKIVEFN
jgi:hypothetical protein